MYSKSLKQEESSKTHVFIGNSAAICSAVCSGKRGGKYPEGGVLGPREKMAGPTVVPLWGHHAQSALPCFLWALWIVVAESEKLRESRWAAGHYQTWGSASLGLGAEKSWGLSSFLAALHFPQWNEQNIRFYPFIVAGSVVLRPKHRPRNQKYWVSEAAWPLTGHVTKTAPQSLQISGPD